jgi:hypothetical protein
VSMAVPASLGEALDRLESSVGYLADLDAAQLPVEALATCVQRMVQADAVTAVAWVHRQDGGHTSLAGLKLYCWWHHHVVLHQMGWQLTVHPDGTSEVKSPGGRIIRSHSPPPAPA